MARGKPEITNGDLFLYCLYGLGGAGKYIDVENVFMEMWRIAPGRFRWRRYDLPNYKVMSKAIVDIGQRGDGELLLGDGDARQLSASGVRWVETRQQRFDRIVSGAETAASARRPSQRVVGELARTRLVRAYLAGEEPNWAREEIAVLLRCSPDAPRSVWRERLETLRSAVSDAGRADLMDFLELLERDKREWFGGGN